MGTIGSDELRAVECYQVISGVRVVWNHERNSQDILISGFDFRDTQNLRLKGIRRRFLWRIRRQFGFRRRNEIYVRRRLENNFLRNGIGSLERIMIGWGIRGAAVG